MIENCLVEKFKCLDNNADTLELIESICSNTVVLDLRDVNNNYVTHVIIDKKTAQMLSDSLMRWINGGTNEKNKR
ncbi:hypothetical protein [Enterococcus sp. DIV1314a]|uniref:hypothetical protein n=1 Tax=Enterococcus sp. DIV1314a TaxID=2774660 RepID=UPI003F209B77